MWYIKIVGGWKIVEAKVDTDKKIFFIILLVSLIGGILGTYSYFSSKSEAENQTINTGTLSLEFDDSTPIVNAKNLSPIDKDMIDGKAAKKIFKIKNTGNVASVATLQLTDITIAEELKSPYFIWTLYSGDSQISEGDFSKLSDGTIELANSIDIVNENEYTLYIWIKNINGQQDDLQGKELSAKISVNAVQA